MSVPKIPGWSTISSQNLKCRSIHTQMIILSDRGCVLLLVLVDFRAAFDTIDHNILLNRLEIYVGISMVKIILI